MQDGQQVATIEAKDVRCLAVSKNGKWIARGILRGDVSVCDAETYETVWTHRDSNGYIEAVDFSPDSTRLVSGSWNGPATIWSVASGKKIRRLQHKQSVIAAKFSSDGDRIVTAAHTGSVLVWNSKDGHLLVDIPVTMTSSYNHGGLHWFNNHIFVVSGSTIKKLDVSTGSTVYEWPVPNSDDYSCIAIPRHGKFIAYSTAGSVTFWDMSESTHLQIGLVKHTENIHSIALSPRDSSLAVGGVNGAIITEGLSHIIVSTYPHWTLTYLMPCSSFPSPRLHSTPQGLYIQVDDAVLDAWKNDQLEDAEALLTTAIHQHQNPNYHFLAARSLVRVRLQHWDEALVDAQTVVLTLLSPSLTLTPSRTKVIHGQPSIIAYIAKSLAHVGKGEKDKAYLACNIAFQHSHSSHIPLPFLIKVCIPALGLRSTVNPFRLLSCLWLENTAMHYLTWIASLLQFDMTQHAIQFRHVHDVVPLMDITTDVSQRLICIFSSGICTRRARNTRMPYGYSSVHVREYSIVRIDRLWWSRW